MIHKFSPEANDHEPSRHSASGIGLAVATILSARPDWEVHILDISQAGQQEVEKLTGTVFHQADVTKYLELSGAFKETFRAHNRLDFVFANAGIIERDNFYAQQSIGMGETISPPPEPDLSSIEVNLTAVMCTTKLAHYYFLRSSSQKRGANLVMTSSCGGLYPSFYSPVYSAAKGVSALVFCSSFTVISHTILRRPLISDLHPK